MDSLRVPLLLEDDALERRLALVAFDRAQRHCNVRSGVALAVLVEVEGRGVLV